MAYNIRPSLPGPLRWLVTEYSFEEHDHSTRGSWGNGVLLMRCEEATNAASAAIVLRFNSEDQEGDADVWSDII